MVNAWYCTDSEEDQRLPHQFSPNQPVSLEQLSTLGVNYWVVKGEEDPKLQQLREQYNYNYKDVIEVSPNTLPNYELKIKSFYEEHLHDDDEIRFVLAGTGYFDVRDKDDKWIRIEVTQDDMISIPAGIYHRFTLDSNNYIKGS